jgi:hypothetical protein
MRAARRRRRTQGLLFLVALGLGAYVWLVYQPLVRQGAELDGPLIELWTELAELSPAAPLQVGDRLPQIDAALDQAREAIDTLGRTREALEARIDPGPGLVERIEAPFQLIEFQNERLLVGEQLTRLAQQRKVTLDPGLASGFPEYMVDRAHPSLLWAQLTLLRHTLTSAINSGVTAVGAARSPAFTLHRGVHAGGEFLVEIPIELELLASAPAAVRFLESISLRSDEIQERGLPEAGADKPAYFIHRVLIRRESREKLDEVRLRLTVSSLVYLREGVGRR